MVQCILAALFFVGQNVSNNLFSHRFQRGAFELCLLNGMALALGTLLLSVLFRPALIPAGALVLAALFGALFVVTISMIAITLSMGPMGMSCLIIDMSTVVSILAGILLWHETVTPMHGISLALVLSSIVLTGLPEHREETSASKKWLAMALITMLFNGVLNIIQKTAFELYPSLNSTDFTFWSLLCGTCCCLIGILFAKLLLKRKTEGDASIWKKMLPYSVGIGLCTAFAYYFQNAALLLLPSIVVFPLVIGLNVALLMLCSVIFFGERLGFRRAIAFIVGMVGILLMNF